MTDTVHQLKIVLRGVDPPVWRRLLVPANMSLDRAAAVLSGAMGWYFEHLCWFDTGTVRYAEEAGQ